MTPKTLKIINGVFWSVLAIALNIGVVVVWHSNGNSTKGLVLGCALYTLCCAGLWYCIHNHINEVNR